MSLIRAQVVVPQIRDRERVVVTGQEVDELFDLGRISSDRVRAAVRFELKPAEIFSGGGLQIDCHVEAVRMLAHSKEMRGAAPIRLAGSVPTASLSNCPDASKIACRTGRHCDCSRMRRLSFNRGHRTD